MGHYIGLPPAVYPYIRVLADSPSLRRSEDTWWGEQSRAWVQRGDDLMCRTALVLLLVFLVGGHYILEEPASSAMSSRSPLHDVLWATNAASVTTSLNAFGAPSISSFCLTTSLPYTVLYLGVLRPGTPTLATHMVEAPRGLAVCPGLQRTLQGPRSYSPEFVAAVTQMWLAYRQFYSHPFA